jgi:hypothetical protein
MKNLLKVLKVSQGPQGPQMFGKIPEFFRLLKTIPVRGETHLSFKTNSFSDKNFKQDKVLIGNTKVTRSRTAGTVQGIALVELENYKLYDRYLSLTHTSTALKYWLEWT